MLTASTPSVDYTIFMAVAAGAFIERITTHVIAFASDALFKFAN
jgi:hypothetical protein